MSAGAGTVADPPIRDAWRRDVALELWIDVQQDPVMVSMAGSLDAATAPSLVAAVRELVEHGSGRVALETGARCSTDAAGRAAIGRLRRQVRAAGGRLVWDGAGEPGRSPGPGDRRRVE
jgi:STAS domain